MIRSQSISAWSQWWTRLRHTAWFQWAHAPLCKRFEHDIWSLGSLHVCRSCILLYASCGLAAGTAMLAGLETGSLSLLTALVLIPATLLSSPNIYRKFSRRWRDTIRAGMGAGLGLWAALFLSGGHWVALATFPILFAIYRFYHSQRRKLKQHMCDGCSDLNTEGICSGYAQQANSIRLYQIQIEDRLNDTHHPPDAAKAL